MKSIELCFFPMNCLWCNWLHNVSVGHPSMKFQVSQILSFLTIELIRLYSSKHFYRKDDIWAKKTSMAESWREFFRNPPKISCSQHNSGILIIQQMKNLIHNFYIYLNYHMFWLFSRIIQQMKILMHTFYLSLNFS